MLLAAAGLGVLIGLVLGSLGGGGSVLTVPALVFLLGLSAQAATTASLVIVGVAAAVSSVDHARQGHTRWRAGLLLAATGVPASVLGSLLNSRVEESLLLIAFSVLMVVAAVGMLVGSPSDDGDGDGQSARRTPRGLVRTALVGLGIGALTGFFGVGGGFVIVPALVLVLGLPMSAAVGTSLLVVALNAAVALVARVGQGSFDWQVIVPFTVAAVLATLVGQRVAGRLPDRALTRGFAVLLVLVAVYTAFSAATGRV